VDALDRGGRAELGASLVVLHPTDLASTDPAKVDAHLARDVAAYAGERGVALALENGPLPFLLQAISEVESLGICLDVGHVYSTPDPMSGFLLALKHRITHLHLQDTLSPPEAHLPWAAKDHYVPGSGGIPRDDWELLAATLTEINFEGIAVFEIRPRNPWQTALLARSFFEQLLGH
jgi:sugar phosphate isomerase/epimerase